MKFEIILTHKLDAESLAAIEKIVNPPRPEPKAEPVKPPSPYEIAFKLWLDAQNFSEFERGDIAGLWKVRMGMRQADEATKRRAREVLQALGAPVPEGL